MDVQHHSTISTYPTMGKDLHTTNCIINCKESQDMTNHINSLQCLYFSYGYAILTEKTTGRVKNRVSYERKILYTRPSRRSTTSLGRNHTEVDTREEVEGHQNWWAVENQRKRFRRTHRRTKQHSEQIKKAGTHQQLNNLAAQVLQVVLQATSSTLSSLRRSILILLDLTPKSQGKQSSKGGGWRAYYD